MRSLIDIIVAGAYKCRSVGVDAPGMLRSVLSSTSVCGELTQGGAAVSTTCCPAGQYTDADTCADCAAGRFMEGQNGASACFGCAAGQYVDVAASDEADDCIGCPAGTYGVADGDEASDCIDCAAGRYDEATSSDEAGASQHGAAGT